MSTCPLREAPRRTADSPTFRRIRSPRLCWCSLFVLSFLFLPSAVAQSTGGRQVDKPIEFTASDSLIIRIRPEGDSATLFGQSAVTYGEAQLNAFQIEMAFEAEELRARGLAVDTGMVGRPRFLRGSEEFLGQELAFNLATERGRVVGARTAMDEGFITGEVVKVDEDSTLYIAGGAYTTCDCEDDPSYTLRSDRMKVVDGQWVYTGPIQLYLFNIPTPLWLPFGFLPAQEGRRSGPLPPTYGEDELGFFLRDWGWYWALNDYMDLQVRFGLWTKGSWQVAPTYRYNRRYNYSGQIAIDYARNRRGEEGDPDFTILNTSSLRWRHDQTINPTSSFNSNVNLSSSGYLRSVSERYDDRMRQTVESAIRYNKRWPNSSRSVSVDLSQRQILATGEATMTFPTLSFTQSGRKPFKREQRAGQRERWYERITYSYNSRLINRYDFRPLPRDTLLARGDTAAAEVSWVGALFDHDLYERATGQTEPIDFSASHSLPLSASFSINRIPIVNRAVRLNFNTNVSYSEDWYLNTIRQRFDEAQNRVITDTEPGFFALRRFSSGASANTTIYGIFPFRVGRLDGFRHTLRPTASFSYSPDFNSEFWGYTRTFENATGDEIRYAIVRNASLGREQKTISFSLANVFETRLLPSSGDTVATARPSTLKLLDVDLSSSYNFAADSMRLADVRFTARTNLFDRLSLNLTGNLSPYKLDPTGRRLINEPVFSLRDFRFARLTRLDLTARASFTSSDARVGRPAGDPFLAQQSTTGPAFGTPPYDPIDPFDTPYANSPIGYADFSIPWSVDLSFTYGLSRPFEMLTKRAIVNAGFDFNVTPRWKVHGRTGYDLVVGEIASTDLSIMRDFECWEMSFRWVPFGRFQSYSFDLHVKSGKLRDLLRIRQPRSDVRGRFSGLVQ